MTEVEIRRSYIIGAWKIESHKRDVAHDILGSPDDPNEDQRDFLNIIGADSIDHDDDHPVGSPVSYRLCLSESEVDRFRRASNFRYAELDELVEANTAPVSPSGAVVPQEKSLRFVGAIFRNANRWHGTNVPVAVLDSGTTAALRSAFGINLVARSVFGDNPAPNEVWPGQEHGCGVASIAIPTGGQLVDCVITQSSTDGSASAITSAAQAAMRWCADQGYKILVFSYGPYTPGTSWTDVLTYLRDRNVHLIVSGGNDGANAMNGPGSYSTTYANVHSIINFAEDTNQRASGSNYASDASGCAPGTNVLVGTSTGETRVATGTSYSGPLVAHLIARGATDGTFTPATVGAALKANTRDTGQPALQQGGGAYDLRRMLIALGALPMAPGRRNLMPSPSYEVDVGGSFVDSTVASATMTRQTSGGRIGVSWGSVTATGAGTVRLYSPAFAATPGSRYSGSCFFRRSKTSPATSRLYFRWYDSSGTSISTNEGPAIPYLNAADTWIRLSMNAYSVIAPANAVTGRIYTFSSDAVANEVIGVDGWLVEEKTKVVEPYFDGSFTNAMWDGTAQQSTSRQRWERNDCPSPRAIAGTGWAGSGSTGAVVDSGINTSTFGMDAPTGARLTQGLTTANGRINVPSKLFDSLLDGQTWSTTVQIDAGLAPTRCTNPVCASAVTGWAAGGTTTNAQATGLSGMVATTGYRATKASAAGAVLVYSEAVTCAAGETITGTLQCRPSVATTVTWYITYYNSSATQIGTTTGNAISVAAGSTTTRAVSGTAPAGTATCRVVAGTGSIAVGATFIVTGARIDGGSDPSASDGSGGGMLYGAVLSCALELSFLNAAGTRIGSTITGTTVTITSGGAAGRLYASGTAPAGTRQIGVVALFRSLAAKQLVYATACRVDQVSDAALPYRDGATTSWRWEGIALQSTSTPGPPLQEPLWEPEPGINGALRWSADLSAADAPAAGYDSSSSQRQRDGTGANGGFNNNEIPWPPTYGPAPFGRQSRAMMIRVPDAFRRYEVNPHSSIRFGDGDEAFFGFAFCLGADMDVRPNDYQVIWQLHGSPSDGSPSVALEASNGRLRLTGGNRRPDPQTLSHNTGATYAYVRDLNTEVVKHRWYNFIAYVGFWSEVTPSNVTPVVGSGRVDVWLDGTKVIDNFVPPCATNYPKVNQSDADDDGKAYLKSGIYHRETGFRGATIWIADQKLATGGGRAMPDQPVTGTAATDLSTI